MVRVFKIGSLVSDSPTGVKSLYAKVTADGNYDTFKEAGTSYSVPSGKTFYITRITYTGKYNAAVVEIGYGDGAVSDSDTAPGGYTSMTSDAGPFRCEAHLPKQLDCFFAIPAGKYPCLRIVGAADGSCIAEGIEV